jgi:hypothetical protein
MLEKLHSRRIARAELAEFALVAVLFMTSYAWGLMVLAYLGGL